MRRNGHPVLAKESSVRTKTSDFRVKGYGATGPLKFPSGWRSF